MNASVLRPDVASHEDQSHQYSTQANELVLLLEASAERPHHKQ